MKREKGDDAIIPEMEDIIDVYYSFNAIVQRVAWKNYPLGSPQNNSIKFDIEIVESLLNRLLQNALDHK